MANAKPPRTPAEPLPTTDYEVLSPLEHDGDRYEIGATVALTAAQAAPLLGSVLRQRAPPA